MGGLSVGRQGDTFVERGQARVEVSSLHEFIGQARPRPGILWRLGRHVPPHLISRAKHTAPQEGRGREGHEHGAASRHGEPLAGLSAPP